MRRLLAEKDDLLEAKDILLQTAARFAPNPSSPRPTVFAQDISYTPSKIVQSCQPSLPSRRLPTKKLEQIQEEDLEERNRKDSPSRAHSICITPIKPVDTESTGKRPAAVLTPLQASVRKRIETAVRQVISQQTTPSQHKMNDEKNADYGSNLFSSPSPLKSPTTKNSIDVAGTPVDRLVYKVKQRIRAAFESIQSNNELKGALQPIITAREVGSVETTLTPIKSVSESKVDDSELALALLTSPPIAKPLTFAADGSEEAVVGKIIQELLAQPHLTPTKALVQECLSTTTSQGTDAFDLDKHDNFILVFVAIDVAEDEEKVLIRQNIIKEDTGMPMDSDGEVVFVRRGPMASIFRIVIFFISFPICLLRFRRYRGGIGQEVSRFGVSIASHRTATQRAVTQ